MRDPRLGSRGEGSRLAAIAALLFAATLLKAYCDQAFGPAAGEDRLMKHLVGIVELAGILMLASGAREARRFELTVTYLLMAGLVVGAALFACRGIALVQAGCATATSARVCAESAALGFAAVACAREGRDPARMGLAFMLVPEMTAALLGYGLLPAAAEAGGVALGGVAPLVSVGALACLALCAIAALAWLEIGGRAGEAEGETEEGPGDPAQAALSELARQHGLTQREVDVARYLAGGLTVKMICEKECLSLNTVQSHCKNLYRKLGIHSREELAAALGEAGCARPSDVPSQD